jgi:hypothetical protein
VKRLLATLALFVLVVSLAADSYAHEKFRIVGTITKFAKAQLEVKQQKDGKVIKIGLDELTIVRRDNNKVPEKELITGKYVVVDALGDSLNDLVAVEIRLVPELPKTPGRE